MKNGFWDRMLIYLYVLLTVLVVITVSLRAFGLDLVSCFIATLQVNAPGILWRLIVLGVAILITLLGICAAVLITPSRKNSRNFVALSSDNGGQVRISLPAVRELARQAIAGISGLQGVAINVSEADEALAVNVAMDVEGGVHVPTVTMNMQTAIRKNIERNCGINVRSVTVDVKSVIPGTGVIAADEVPVKPVPGLSEMMIESEAEVKEATEGSAEESANAVAETEKAASEAEKTEEKVGE